MAQKAPDSHSRHPRICDVVAVPVLGLVGWLTKLDSFVREFHGSKGHGLYRIPDTRTVITRNAIQGSKPLIFYRRKKVGTRMVVHLHGTPLSSYVCGSHFASSRPVRRLPGWLVTNWTIPTPSASPSQPPHIKTTCLEIQRYPMSYYDLSVCSVRGNQNGIVGA